jgi:hypothetical protein
MKERNVRRGRDRYTYICVCVKRKTHVEDAPLFSPSSLGFFYYYYYYYGKRMKRGHLSVGVGSIWVWNMDMDRGIMK